MMQDLIKGFVGVFSRRVGPPALRAGDRVFADKLFWAKYRFRWMRATYYYDLAKRIQHMPGEPIANHFAKDAARRAGEPLGILAAHWLSRSEGIDGQMQRSRLTEIFRGTVPDEDIPILAVAEDGGDIREGLETLARNLTALGEARAGIALTLAGVVMTLVILHAYLAAMAFLVGPKVDESFRSMLDVGQYGPIGKTFHNTTTFLRHWGWLVVLLESELACGCCGRSRAMSAAIALGWIGKCWSSTSSVASKVPSSWRGCRPSRSASGVTCAACRTALR
ncbi:hypothetical protein AU476_05515 [Cupriavidus sp. UYMSc13B]|nr:hypothetical protein AU476_05515 [Cupriavidus sp. UYMSc13B]